MPGRVLELEMDDEDNVPLSGHKLESSKREMHSSSPRRAFNRAGREFLLSLFYMLLKYTCRYVQHVDEHATCTPLLLAAVFVTALTHFGFWFSLSFEHGYQFVLTCTCALHVKCTVEFVSMYLHLRF